jgi:hypothetical protein
LIGQRLYAWMLYERCKEKIAFVVVSDLLLYDDLVVLYCIA